MRTTLASDKAGTPVNVYRVAFEPGARTHWHTHDGPQWLLVVEGRIRDSEARRAGEGGRSRATPWSFSRAKSTGTARPPSSRGVHLAVNVNAATNWMEPVTDEQYQGDRVLK